MIELPEELTKGRKRCQVQPFELNALSSSKPVSRSDAQRRENRRRIEDILEDRELRRQLKEDLMI